MDSQDDRQSILSVRTVSFTKVGLSSLLEHSCFDPAAESTDVQLVFGRFSFSVLHRAARYSAIARFRATNAIWCSNSPCLQKLSRTPCGNGLSSSARRLHESVAACQISNSLRNLFMMYKLIRLYCALFIRSFKHILIQPNFGVWFSRFRHHVEKSKSGG